MTLVSRQAIQHKQDTLVKYINSHAGPRIYKTAHAGYGLLAERPYQVGEVVTYYGGTVVDPSSEGDYVIQLNNKVAIDGYGDFLAETERGRWINDAPVRQQNVQLRKEPRGQLVFKTTRRVAQGEEFLWNYGPHYRRSWNQPIEACAVCHEKPHFVEDTEESRLFCGSGCQWVDFDMVGYNAKEEVWDKLVRDVSVHDVWRVCQADQVLRDICDSDEFKRRFVQKKGADVEFFINEAIELGEPERVKMWLDTFLEARPNYPNRRGLEMWSREN